MPLVGWAPRRHAVGGSRVRHGPITVFPGHECDGFKFTVRVTLIEHGISDGVTAWIYVNLSGGGDDWANVERRPAYIR